MSGEALRAIAADIARHLRWAQSLGEKSIPFPRGDAAAREEAGALAGEARAPVPPPPVEADGPVASRSAESPRPLGEMERSAVGRGRPPAPGGLRPAGTPARMPPPQRSVGPAPGRRGPERPPAAPRAERPGAPADRRPAPARLFELGLASPALQAVRDELGACRRCKLCEGRRNLVFGTGNPQARLVFVGEGPGAEEDAQGIPFVGAAGQLLTRMIQAMGLRREEVYICNVVKCRPPGNRTPEADEVEACEPFLQAQLRAIGPEVIVALGKSAAQSLLRESTPITRLRGQWRRYQGIDLMPTFHPAYLLRSPHEKAKAWADLQQVMRRLGLPPRR